MDRSVLAHGQDFEASMGTVIHEPKKGKMGVTEVDFARFFTAFEFDSSLFDPNQGAKVVEKPLEWRFGVMDVKTAPAQG